MYAVACRMRFKKKKQSFSNFFQFCIIISTEHPVVVVVVEMFMRFNICLKIEWPNETRHIYRNIRKYKFANNSLSIII